MVDAHTDAEAWDSFDDGWYDKDEPEPREEPNCGQCSDSRTVLRYPLNYWYWRRSAYRWMFSGVRGWLVRRFGWRPCPDCEPATRWDRYVRWPCRNAAVRVRAFLRRGPDVEEPF